MKNWKTVIVEIQHKLGLTETQLAKRVGCSQPAINRIKSGKRRPMYELGAKLVSLHAKVRSI